MEFVNFNTELQRRDTKTSIKTLIVDADKKFTVLFNF